MIRQRFIASGLLFCAAILMMGQIAVGKTIYVDAGASGGDAGTTWEDAFIYLQDALAISVLNDEIHIAAGTYRPDQGDGYAPGDREASFVLVNGVRILGGYPAGGGERNPQANITILSGDLLGDDNPQTPVLDLLTDPNRAENSYHVVRGQLCGPPTVIDGLTIVCGNADGADEWANGGGFYNTINSSPTIINCIFSRNAAGFEGGGAYNSDISCAPSISGCQFTSNLAFSGAGMACTSNSFALVIADCGFYDNVATNDGGGLRPNYASVTVENCIFEGNSAKYGGGIRNLYSHPTIKDCDFTLNAASVHGGGLYNGPESNPELERCIFSENAAVKDGGAISNDTSSPTLADCQINSNTAGEYGGAVYNKSSSPVVDNTIFFNNTAAGNGGCIYNEWSSPHYTNCKFLGNEAETGSGGAIFNYATCRPEFANCIFSANKSPAAEGGAIYNHRVSSGGTWRYSQPKLSNCSLSWNSALTIAGGIRSNSAGHVITVTNCILWGNIDTNGSLQDESAQISGGTVTINYSCLQGWTGALGGAGNIGDDPLLVDPDGPDWLYGTLDDNLRLGLGSPCIDAGDGTAPHIELDLDGYPRCQDDWATLDTGLPCGLGHDPNGVIDMGAYEVQPGVFFADANLRAAVEEELAKQEIYPPITVPDMNCLTYLDANDRGIVDLNGLEHAHNLTELYLHRNDINDLYPLKDLENLSILYLYLNRRLSDLEPLRDVSTLTKLHVGYNDISNIEPLTELTELRYLNLTNSPVLPLEAYRDYIPLIKENNRNLTDFRYDPGCTVRPADVNADCRVDFLDFAEMASQWLTCNHMYPEMCP